MSIVKTLNCCAKKCLNVLFASSYSAAIKARKKCSEKSLKEQADWLKDYLADHHIITSDGKFVYKFVVGLQEICRTAWMQVHGLTKSRFYKLKNAFQGETMTLIFRN